MATENNKKSDGFVMALIQAFIVAFLIIASDYEGSISRYDSGVMERNLEWRHTNGYPAGFDPYSKDYDGYIAVMNCRDVGKEAELTLTVNGTTLDPLHVLISDCTEDVKTMKWMVDENITAELDWETWQRLGIQDGSGAWGKVEIYD